MDKVLKKNKYSTKRIAFGVGLALLSILFFWGFKNVSRKVYVVDGDGIKIGEVKYADFKDEILINGIVEPKTTVLVNTTEGGAVEEIYVEDGRFVEKGTPLLKIGNPNALLQYMTQETAIIEQINNLRNTKLDLDKNQRKLEESLLDLKYNLEEVKRKYHVDSVLFLKNAIAKNEYLKSWESYHYYSKKKSLMERTINKESIDFQRQIIQINSSIALMERNLEVIRESVSRLTIKAPISGQLSSFDPVLGMSFKAGQTIGKISRPDGFLVRSQIEQFYLTSIVSGQKATFNFNGNNIKIEVKKVLPEVVNGKFQVDFVFSDKEPSGIRQGQSLQILLGFASKQKSLIIPRGSYYYSTGGKWVYVVSENGEATKRNISVGKQNPDFYQVLDGLKVGEKIITSSYDLFKENEFLKID